MAVISELIIDGENKTSHENAPITEIVIDNNISNELGIPEGVYHFAKSSESINNVCENAVEEPIIDLKISGNSIQEGEPTPETPVDIESVGDKTVNLFNKNDTSSIVTNLYPNSDFFATGSVWRGFIFECLPNTTYSLSKIAGQTCYLGSSTDYPANGVAINVKVNELTASSISITTGENDKYLSAFFYRTNVDTIDYQTVLDSIQIEIGNTATDYEPYGYKIPVKVGGKNLVNPSLLLDPSLNNMYSMANNKVTINRDNTFAWENLNPLTLKPNTQYCLSLENITLVDIRTPSNIKLFIAAETTIAVFTTDSTGLACFKFFSPSGTLPYEIGFIQLEEGSVATEYEPYVEPTTTNIYLNEPLRKIGDYADYIDYKNKKVVRQVQELDLTKYTWLSSGDGETRFYYIITSEKPAISGWQYIRCNILNSAYIGSDSLNKGIEAYSSGIVRARPDLTIYDTLEKWQEYVNNNECYLMFAIADIEETIEIPEISTIKGLNSFSAETTIEPSEIRVNYWKQI